MSEHDPSSDEGVGILLVDDDPAFVEAAATFVGRHLPRARTYTAGSPADAREFMASRGDDVDCVVSDYEMTRESGIDFLRSVRETRPDLPFILFTGKGSEEVAGEAFRAGATDYLKKEMGTEQFEVLARRIDQAITAVCAARELARNRKLLHAAVDAVDDPFYAFDTAGRFLRWNDALVTQTGYSDEEVAEMHPTEFFEGADRERVSEAIDAVVDGEDATVEASVRTKGGDSRRYEFTGSPVVDEAGEPFAVCGVGRDRVEELETVLDRLGVPVFDVDADGTLAGANAACERLGVDPDDAGGSAWTVLPWSADSPLAKAVAEAVETGAPVETTATLPEGGSARAVCDPLGPGGPVRVSLGGVADASAARN
ncbi:PAS domain S-box [Halogeometricum pallidum JCM 14848]|uniref:PAS domain S-box n=1 Tax=Halogeometricum pallidum JCM 14848 TaxID=1227487 RepID=M0DF55_HALPD|nr:PAS domain-containing protein [Halogeometricum pallidum]ELZ34075.1 PAS domain S-box [Halogeometricum pallidum JCM 14848]